MWLGSKDHNYRMGGRALQKKQYEQHVKYLNTVFLIEGPVIPEEVEVISKAKDAWLAICQGF